MKLAKKKGLFLNVSNTLPRSGYGGMYNTASQSSSPTNSCASSTASSTCGGGSYLKFNLIQPNRDRLTPIVDGIYLGNYACATDFSQLQKERITHIVNCSPSDCPNLFENDITYLNINIQDNWKTNLFWVIYIILDFLKHALATQVPSQGQGRVLIHCNQGISRSPSIVIAYLIYTQKIDASTALERLKLKYPYADPNLDFEIQLNEMFKEVLEEDAASAAANKSLFSHEQKPQQSEQEQVLQSDKLKQLQPEQQYNQQTSFQSSQYSGAGNVWNGSCLSSSHLQQCSPPLLSSSCNSSHLQTPQPLSLSSSEEDDLILVSHQQQQLHNLHRQKKKEQQQKEQKTSEHITVSTPEMPQLKLNYDSYKKTRRPLYPMYESAILAQTSSAFKNSEFCKPGTNTSFSRSVLLPNHPIPQLSFSSSSKESLQLFPQQQQQQQQQHMSKPLFQQLQSSTSPMKIASTDSMLVSEFRQHSFEESEENDDDNRQSPENKLNTQQLNLQILELEQKKSTLEQEGEIVDDFEEDFVLPPTMLAVQQQLDFSLQDDELLLADHQRLNMNKECAMTSAQLSQIYENHTIEEEDELSSYHSSLITYELSELK